MSKAYDKIKANTPLHIQILVWESISALDIKEIKRLTEELEKVKKLSIPDVSQQSELLKSFADWLQSEVWDDKHDDFSDYVEDYIKTL